MLKKIIQTTRHLTSYNFIVKGLLSVCIYTLVCNGLLTTIVKAVDYECGTYSAADYSRECPDSTPPINTDTSHNKGTSIDSQSDPTDQNTKTDTATEGNGVILLNKFELYSTENGQSFDLSQRQIVYFLVGDHKHSITVKKITSEYLIVTIASTPTDVTIQRSKTIKYDVDGDKKYDIAISYLHSTNNGALLSFSSNIASNNLNIRMQDTTNMWPWVIIASIGILSFITTVIITRRTKTKKY